MKSTKTLTLIVLAVSGSMLLAQDTAPAPQQQPQPGTWRRVGDPPPADMPAANPADQQQQPSQDPSEPVARSDSYGQPGDSGGQGIAPQGAPNVPARRPAYGLPPELTVKPGTFLTARMNQLLNSDRNHPGDTFMASLGQSIIVDGVVVAVRGQTVYGRVVEAEKAHNGHPSRLKLELTGLTLADGTQMPIGSQLVAQQGPRTPGEAQAGTIVGGTAVGAGIGAVAGGGGGAAIGAGVGAAASIMGVLLTRDHPTIIYPETLLTFQTTTPVTVATDHAPQAFRFAGPQDYQQPPAMQQMGYGPRPAYGYSYAPGYPPAYGPGYSPYYSYYPYYWGPSFAVGFGWRGGYGYRYGYGYGRRWR